MRHQNLKSYSLSYKTAQDSLQQVFMCNIEVQGYHTYVSLKLSIFVLLDEHLQYKPEPSRFYCLS